MKFKLPSFKNFFKTREVKQYVPVATQSFHGWLQGIGRSDVAKTVAVLYYIKCYPVSSAIGEISDRLKNIIPTFLDKNEEEVVNDITQFLKQPNPRDSFSGLLNKMNINYKTTGEIYIEKVGISRVMEINILASAKVFAQYERNGMPESFIYSDSESSVTYTINSDGRYFDRTGTRELIYYFEYNPESNLRGLSPLSAVSLEIEQYLSAGTHNLALLTNGIKPSVVLSSKSDMMPNPEQVQQFKELLNEFYSGSNNAGNYLITGNFDVNQVTEKSDMDYKELNNSAKNAIFQKIGVPITIADTTASTFNNRQTDTLAFYDDTVIPLFNMYTMFLVKALKNDFKSTQEIESITINETDIPALSERSLRNLERRSKVGHLSINEMREIDNYAKVQGGDVIYRPASDIPVATDEPIEEEIKRQINYEISLRESK